MVSNTFGFTIGDVVIIGGREHKQIVGFASILIDTPLQYSYPKNTEIKKASKAVTENYQPDFAQHQAPVWASVGGGVLHTAGKKGIIVSKEPWKIRWQASNAPVSVHDWRDIKQGPPAPAWADVGVKVHRGKMLGTITSKQPWRIMWQSGFSQLVFYWAGIAKAILTTTTKPTSAPTPAPMATLSPVPTPAATLAPPPKLETTVGVINVAPPAKHAPPATHAPAKQPVRDAGNALAMLTGSADKIDAQSRINALSAKATEPPSTTEWPTVDEMSPVMHGKSSPCSALVKVAQMASGRRSPILEYTSSFGYWLRTSEHQVLIATLAMVLGLFTSCLGQIMWQGLFTVIMAFLGAAVVYYETEALSLASSTLAHKTIVFEAALFIGFAVHVGFEGSQVLAGAVLGFWGAYATPFIAQTMEEHFAGLALFFYIGASVTGCLIFALLRRWVLAAVSPLLGGLLVSSASGLLVGRFVSTIAPGVSKEFFPASDMAWIDAMSTLLGNAPAPCFFLQCGFSLFGTFVYHKLQRKTPALALAGVGILMSMVFGTSSLGCGLPMSCPSDAPWRWLLVGSLMWLIIVVYSMSHQLGVLARPLDHAPLQGYSMLKTTDSFISAAPDNVWKKQETATTSTKTTPLTSQQITQLKQEGASMAGLANLASGSSTYGNTNNANITTDQYGRRFDQYGRQVDEYGREVLKDRYGNPIPHPTGISAWFSSCFGGNQQGTMLANGQMSNTSTGGGWFGGGNQNQSTNAWGQQTTNQYAGRR